MHSLPRPRAFLVAYGWLAALANEAAEPVPSEAEALASEFKPPASPIGEMGVGQIDVGVGEHAWNCHKNEVSFQGGVWNRHNPNAGVGLLKASHCQAVCGRDFFCAAFVYVAEGYKNSTAHNPTGIMPGSCWKLSNRPWPEAVPLQGFLTCWKPNATNATDVTPPLALASNGSIQPIATNASLENPAYSSQSLPAVVPTFSVPKTAVATLAPVALPTVDPNSGIATGAGAVTAPTVLPVVPSISSVRSIPAAPPVEKMEPISDEPHGGGGFPWKWVVVAGVLVGIGGGVAAIALGFCGNKSDGKPKKKKRTVRGASTLKSAAVPVREQELEPLIAAQEPDPIQSRSSAGVASPSSSAVYPVVQQVGPAVAYYSAPVAGTAVAMYPQQAGQMHHIGAIPMQPYPGQYVQVVR